MNARDQVQALNAGMLHLAFKRGSDYSADLEYVLFGRAYRKTIMRQTLANPSLANRRPEIYG